MTTDPTPPLPPIPDPAPHRRRPRYAGRNPRRFEDKYKEHAAARHPGTVAKVLASGKTPAGMHRPIMVAEVLSVLSPGPGMTGVDCTLGYGGHARELLARVAPGGRLVALDADPLELPRTEARLRDAGFGPEVLLARRTNFAALPAVLAGLEIPGVDFLLADLGVSSMQLDDPARGFTLKGDGPLDMRMNPDRGSSAQRWIEGVSPAALAVVLRDNADEPRADKLAPVLAGRSWAGTAAFAGAVRAALRGVGPVEVELTVRRVFQAVRIAVNDEFAVLDTLLRHLPGCLNPGGRAAFLTFHSGEDRRVKRAFESGLAVGAYAEISPEVIRPSPEERRDNPRSAPAKLRWARKS